jgi:hypothetical protein
MKFVLVLFLRGNFVPIRVDSSEFNPSCGNDSSKIKSDSNVNQADQNHPHFSSSEEFVEVYFDKFQIITLFTIDIWRRFQKLKAKTKNLETKLNRREFKLSNHLHFNTTSKQIISTKSTMNILIN